jgi:hypothetical protein
VTRRAVKRRNRSWVAPLMLSALLPHPSVTFYGFSLAADLEVLQSGARSRFRRSQLSNSAKDGIEHGLGKLAGESVLLARMV